MKTDKELVELAAKAAGIPLACWDEESQYWIREKDDPEKVNQQGSWGAALFEPLTDDGDALRLAVKLHLCLIWPERNGQAYSVGAGTAGTERMPSSEVLTGDDFAATRRAIVRAAAAIGEAMP